MRIIYFYLATGSRLTAERRMKSIGRTCTVVGLCVVIAVPLMSSACTRKSESRAAAPQSLQMGGAKSVTRFFVTSKGLGRGGNLGGLAGADAHCQALAK